MLRDITCQWAPIVRIDNVECISFLESCHLKKWRQYVNTETDDDYMGCL